MRNPDLKQETFRQTEERYLKMIDEIEDYAIILLDQQGIIQNWNKGAQKLKGYKPNEIIGKSFSTFYTPEDQARELPKTLLSIAARDGRATHEGWRVKQNGTRFWGNIIITALHNDHNEVIGYTKVTRDLTERKLAEDQQAQHMEQLQRRNEELRRSEERFHKMVEEVQDYAILLLDNDGNIQNWNHGAEKIKGYTASEIVGKNFRIFYTEEDLQANLPAILLNKARTEGRATHEGKRLRKDGTSFWGSIVLTALHDDDNNIIGFSKVTRDLTEKKLAEDALKSYNAQLEQKNQQLEEFAYVASHDLKEPLRKILTFGDLLKHTSAGDNLGPKAIDYVNRMQEASQRMMKLIENLLLFSRVGNDDQTFEETDLNKVLERVLRDLEPSILEKKAHVTITNLPVLKARPIQMQQLFQNLIANSLKFNNKPVPEVTISSLLEQKDGATHCRISVEDNGIGFDVEHKHRIFKVFQRLHGRSEYAGSGIGLAICKKIVEEHNGTIEATGEEDKGATFLITIPCDQPV
jgi:PAS domain S-box-containing protein